MLAGSLAAALQHFPIVPEKALASPKRLLLWRGSPLSDSWWLRLPAPCRCEGFSPGSP